MIVFVGQAPSRPVVAHNPEIPGTMMLQSPEPLAGSSGRRLAALLGIDFDRFIMHHRINLNGRYPGRRGKGDGFDVLEGKAQAAKLTKRLRSGDFIVLLGANVARCFGLKWKPCWVGRIGPARALILSHTSGVNRHFNDPLHRTVARQTFYACLPGVDSNNL